MNYFTPQSLLSIIVLGALGLAVICLILAIIALVKLSHLKRKLHNWKTISTNSDLEAVFHETQHAVQEANLRVDTVENSITNLLHSLERKVSTPQIQRYNAFSEVGNDLSYSVALLDDHGDGVVLSSIYGRDDSVTYGKPVEAGESAYQLTGEEQDVIRRLTDRVAKQEEVTLS